MEGHDLASYAGIELGGTKCVLAVGDGSERWIGTVVPTSDPETTTKAAADWFCEAERTSWRGWPILAKFAEALGSR